MVEKQLKPANRNTWIFPKAPPSTLAGIPNNGTIDDGSNFDCSSKHTLAKMKEKKVAEMNTANFKNEVIEIGKTSTLQRRGLLEGLNRSYCDT